MTNPRHGSPDHELRFVGSGLQMPERVVRMSIAALVPLFGVIGLVMLASDEGPHTTAARVVLMVVAASTVPAAVLIARANLTPIWWARRPRPWGVNQLFVIYGDLGVSAAVFTFSDVETALFGSLLFAILSAYVAFFGSAALRNGHIAFTTTVILVLSGLLWLDGEYGWPSVIARCLVALAVVNGTVLLQSMFAFGVRQAIRDTLLHAHQDPLTSLWNRRGFTYWATATVVGSRGAVGLLIIDIDHYKTVNDTHGHRVGDEVLQVAARRLKDVLGERGVLARTGGDEFAVAAERPLAELLALAESIRVGVYRADDTAPVTASVGVAVTGSSDTDRSKAEQVLSAMLDGADTALYEAKARGRNRVAFVDLDDAEGKPRIVER